MQGLKALHTAYVAMHRQDCNLAWTDSKLGKAVGNGGVCLEDVDEWRSIIACAADFSADSEVRRRRKASRSGPPRQA